MTRARYLLLTAAMFAILLVAKLTDLDLGGFGTALLFTAAVFGILALAKGGAKEDNNGRS